MSFTSKHRLLPLALILCFTIIGLELCAQNEPSADSLPYYSIGEYPSAKTSGAVLQRLVDGLGYRYYWATEKLRTEDLEFKPGETNRTSRELLDHIYALSRGIRLFSEGQALERGEDTDSLSWDELRSSTLNNLKNASENFSQISDSQLFESKLTFKRGERTSDFDMWHIINGQITDAIYHTGQIVGNRRASGNPIDPRVNVFRGVTR